MNNFYTYIFIDLNNSVPFYVGKGCGYRVNKHFYSAKNNPKSQLHYKINKLTEDKILVKLINCETEDEAFIREIHLINLYGRKNINTGSLLNRTDGGEGLSGHIASADTRKKISNTHKNKPKSLEHKKKISLSNSGRYVTETWKQKISVARKGKQHSEETKRKISEAVIKTKKSNQEKFKC